MNDARTGPGGDTVDALLHRMHAIVDGTARFLLAQQVVAPDLHLDLPVGHGLRRAVSVLRGSPQAMSVVLHRTAPDAVRIGAEGAEAHVRGGEFVRIGLDGGVGHIPGFRGCQPTHKSFLTEPPGRSLPPPTASRLRAIATRLLGTFPPLLNALREVKDRLDRSPPEDLAHCTGITYRLHLDVNSDRVHLESYDEGGFFDSYVNNEGQSYPAQVPGNYYADAYALLLFQILHARDRDPRWCEAGAAAHRFLVRTYPQYRPARIVWHHSDFKNAAILEAASRLPDEHGMRGELTSLDLVEDWYEPTNVFALRYHWWALHHALFGSSESRRRAEACLERLAADQTEDGLFHDNIDTYPDAHDLTYHQYTTACLAMGLSSLRTEQGLKLLDKALRFSLSTLTPNGEPAYVGRASNNVHHSASAVLAYARALRSGFTSESYGTVLRAIAALLGPIERHQSMSGLIPTALNAQIAARIGWNHCETPYNAYCGAALAMAALDLEITVTSTSQQAAPAPRLPLERPGTWLADDAGYATISTHAGAYLVVFSGCARSYAWSGGVHVTGVPGTAQLGWNGIHSCLPVIEFNARDQVLMSDLPIIDGCIPFGRGKLALRYGGTALLLTVSYDRADFERLYFLQNGALTMANRLTPHAGHASCSVDGLAAACVSENPEWSSQQTEPTCIVAHRCGKPALSFRAYDASLTPLHADRSPQIASNPRGHGARWLFAPSRISAPTVTVQQATPTDDHTIRMPLLLRGRNIIVPHDNGEFVVDPGAPWNT